MNNPCVHYDLHILKWWRIKDHVILSVFGHRSNAIVCSIIQKLSVFSCT